MEAPQNRPHPREQDFPYNYPWLLRDAEAVTRTLRSYKATDPLRQQAIEKAQAHIRTLIDIALQENLIHPQESHAQADPKNDTAVLQQAAEKWVEQYDTPEELYKYNVPGLAKGIHAELSFALQEEPRNQPTD